MKLEIKSYNWNWVPMVVLIIFSIIIKNVFFNDKGDAFIQQGKLKFKSRDYSGALTDFNKAIEIDPKDPNNYIWRGKAKEKLGDYLGWSHDFQKAIEIDPKILDIRK